jgi:hypothetical protein
MMDEETRIRSQLSKFEEEVEHYQIDDVDEFRELEKKIITSYQPEDEFYRRLTKIKQNPNYKLVDTPEIIALPEKEIIALPEKYATMMDRCRRLESFVRNEAAPLIEADFGQANFSESSIFYEFQQFVVNPHLTPDDLARFCKLWGPNKSDKVLIVYHGTKNKFRDQILQSRTLLLGRALHGSGVYSATDASTALDYNANPKINGVFQLLVCIALTNPGFLSDQASTPDTLDQGHPSIPRPTNYVISKEEGAILPIGVVNYTYRNKTAEEEKMSYTTMPLSENINGVMIQTSPSQSVSKTLGGRRSRRKIRKSRRGGGTWTDWMLGRTAPEQPSKTSWSFFGKSPTPPSPIQPQSTAAAPTTASRSSSVLAASPPPGPSGPSGNATPNIKELGDVMNLLSSYEEQIIHAPIYETDEAEFRGLEDKIMKTYPQFIDRLNTIKKNPNYTLGDKIERTPAEIEEEKRKYKTAEDSRILVKKYEAEERARQYDEWLKLKGMGGGSKGKRSRRRKSCKSQSRRRR